MERGDPLDGLSWEKVAGILLAWTTVTAGVGRMAIGSWVKRREEFEANTLGTLNQIREESEQRVEALRRETELRISDLRKENETGHTILREVMNNEISVLRDRSHTLSNHLGILQEKADGLRQSLDRLIVAHGTVASEVQKLTVTVAELAGALGGRRRSDP